MKLFKTVDDKLAKLGFKKDEEASSKYITRYKRYIKLYGYNQIVDIIHKASGRHILQSYDPNLGDNESIGNTCIGLTYTELKLFTKKMAQLNLKS